MKRPSLFRALLWRGIVILAAVLVTVWALLPPLLDQTVYAQVQQDLQEQADWIALRQPPDRPIAQWVEDWGRDHKQTRLGILDAGGRVLADSQPRARPLSTVRRGYETLVGIAALPDGTQVVLNRFGRPSHPVHPEFIVIIAVFVAFAAVVLYPLGRDLAKTFKRLSQAAGRVSTGHFGETMDLPKLREVAGLVASFNDMSLHLRDAEIRQKRLIADVSHELRSPLGRLRALAETIERHPQEAASFSRQIDGEISLLDRLVGDMLEIARFDGGQSKLSPRTVSLNDWVQASCGNARVKTAETDITVEIDPQRLKQAVGNLIDNANAAKASRIDLIVAVSRESWTLTVTDDGCGIAEDDLPHVFDRFFRAEKHRGHHNGAGLGLSIVKAIIEAHQGSVAIASNEGQGTQVVLRFPRQLDTFPTNPT